MRERTIGIFSRLEHLKAEEFRNRRLTSEVVGAIEELIEVFRTSNLQERNEIVGAMVPRASFAFLLYASQMAVKSVREDKPNLLESGLMALAIENCTFDARDTLLALAKLHHSAKKFSNVDADALFEKVASIACAPFKATISGFAHRAEGDKTLRLFGLKESLVPFDYQDAREQDRRDSFWRRIRQRLLH